MLCYALLCYALLCYAVLCHALLCYDTCCAVLRVPQAIRDVQRFSHAAFAQRFKAIVQRGALSKPLRHLVAETYGGRGGAGAGPACLRACLPAAKRTSVSFVIFELCS